MHKGRLTERPEVRSKKGRKPDKGRKYRVKHDQKRI